MARIGGSRAPEEKRRMGWAKKWGAWRQPLPKARWKLTSLQLFKHIADLSTLVDRLLSFVCDLEKLVVDVQMHTHIDGLGATAADPNSATVRVAEDLIASRKVKKSFNFVDNISYIAFCVNVLAKVHRPLTFPAWYLRAIYRDSRICRCCRKVPLPQIDVGTFRLIAPSQRCMKLPRGIAPSAKHSNWLLDSPPLSF